MALATNYTFTPGGAGSGSVVLTGLNIQLDQLQLIVNNTTGEAVFVFTDPSKGATRSFGSGNTTFTLEHDTSGMLGSDRLAIYYADVSPFGAVNIATETTLVDVRDRFRVSAFSLGETQSAATGTNWTALTAGACTAITIRNRTETTLSFRVGGSGAAISIADNEDVLLPCLANSSEWQFRRLDTSNTQVTVQFLRITR